MTAVAVAVGYNLLLLRWGELIFDASDFDSFWDGTYQGLQSPVGTYTYRIDYKLKQTELRKVILGHINLIR